MGKRIFDLVFALVALLVLLPLLGLLFVSIRTFLGRPAFFVQTRAGLNGRLFKLIKFRTMKIAFDGKGNLLADCERLSTFGNFLRRSSLDELPELWNIVRGDMSFVGPRPLLPEYLNRYNERQLRRHEVVPGLTGWAQINGRNRISWEDRFEMDVWYVENRSFLLDLKIILLTFGAVLKTSDVAAEKHATMTPFVGNEENRLAIFRDGDTG